MSEYTEKSTAELREAVLAGDMLALDELVARAEMSDKAHLTGLLNKRGFEREIAKEENRVKRGQSIGGVVLNIDLAGFKRINDTYGEKAGGDVALKKFAEFMIGFGFRDVDILANPGGDEFFVILTNTSMDFPQYDLKKDTIVRDFDNASSNENNVWDRAEKFMRDSRLIPFEGIDKFGQPFMDVMRARITCAPYGRENEGKPTLSQALANSELQTSLLKKLTKQYVLGGR